MRTGFRKLPGARRKAWERSSANRRRRRGALLILAMACLGATVLMLAMSLRSALSERRALLVRGRSLQADWLAESGLQRAVARLTLDPNYAGEKWVLEADRLGGRDAAMVTIAIETIRDRPNEKRVRVDASFPTGRTLHATRIRETIINTGRNDQ